MPRILVTPLSLLNDAAKRHRPSHVVTLIGPATAVETPEGIVAGHHLRLDIHDIDVPQPELIAPASTHIRELLSFAGGWDCQAPILVHCWAGISRSTAAAFIIACSRNDGAEMDIAKAMRQRAPHANPNRLMVRHADALLGRGGRMVAAVQSMTPATEAYEGELFHIPIAREKLWDM